MYTEDGQPIDMQDDLLLTPLSKLQSQDDLRRETDKLPLPQINFELFARRDNIGAGTFPNVRFAERDQRFRLYHDFYRGDVSKLTPDKSYARVSKNYFRRVCEIISALLTSAEITVSGIEVEDSMLQNVAADLIVDQIRYGGALLRTTVDIEGNTYMDVIDPTCWYPLMDGGHILAVPFTSDESESYRHDRIRFTIIEPDGTVEEQVWVYGNERNSANKLIKGTKKQLPNLQFITKILRSPHISNSFWGTSKFDDLATLVYNLTVRMSSFAKILNAHENPFLNAYISDADKPDFAGTNPEESQDEQKVNQQGAKALAEFRRQNFAIVGDEMQKLEYLTWDGQLPASTWFIEYLEASVSMITGIPQPLLSGQEIPSGIALKRMYTVLYADTLATLNDTKFGLEYGLGMLLEGGEVTIEWPHFFDELQDNLDKSENPFGEFMDEEEDEE